MTHKIFSIFLFLLFSNFTTKAQESILDSTEINENTLKFKKLIKLGNTAFNEKDFYTAIEKFVLALNQKEKIGRKKDIEINFQLGESFYRVRDYKPAAKHFSIAASKDKKSKNPIIVYQLANSLKYLGQYAKAKKTYRDFQTVKPKKIKKLDFEIGRARLEIRGCTWGDTLVVDSPLYEIEHLDGNVNSIYAEFGPTLRGKELVFTKIKNEGDNATNYSQIFYSDILNNKFLEAQPLSRTINKDSIYVGNPSFTGDGKTIYFTMCNYEKNKSICAIYQSKIEKGKWTIPQKLGENINEPGTSSSQPQITINEANETVLYFVAERVNGRGGKDIWVSKQNENGGFERAKNLGYPINTRYDDISPFYHKESKTLYFSSNGHISLGGFDIFKSKLDEDGEIFHDPENLAYPINSSVDDYDITLNEDGAFGFLVSNREGTFTERSSTCCDDIFKVISTEVNLKLEGLVYEETNENRKIAKIAKIELLDDDDNLQTFNFNGEPFYLNLEEEMIYKLTAFNNDFKEQSEIISTKNLGRRATIYKDIFLTEKVILDTLIGTIYYEFDNAKLTSDAPEVLKEVVDFLLENINLKIKVAAHTDITGPLSYNMELSKRRSEAAKNYLISQGIKKDRLTREWYGPNFPVAPNRLENGADNPKGRALNRRTEFIIILE